MAQPVTQIGQPTMAEKPHVFLRLVGAHIYKQQLGFLDPRSGLPGWRLLQSKAFRSKRKIRHEAGEIVIFPSYLVHWVYPTEAGGERVTTAFNITLRKGPGGEVEGGEEED